MRMTEWLELHQFDPVAADVGKVEQKKIDDGWDGSMAFQIRRRDAISFRLGISSA
jgi:hypothetical protein